FSGTILPPHCLLLEFATTGDYLLKRRSLSTLRKRAWLNLGDGFGSLLFLPRVVAVLCAPSLPWWRSLLACMPAYGRCCNGNRRYPARPCRWRVSPTRPSPDRSIPITAIGRRPNRSGPT